MNALSPELYEEYISIQQIPHQSEEIEALSGLIVIALQEKRVADAVSLSAQRSLLGYTVRPLAVTVLQEYARSGIPAHSGIDRRSRSVNLKIRLDRRYDMLAEKGDVSSCILIAEYLEKIQATLDLYKPIKPLIHLSHNTHNTHNTHATIDSAAADVSSTKDAPRDTPRLPRLHQGPQSTATLGDSKIIPKNDPKKDPSMAPKLPQTLQTPQLPQVPPKNLYTQQIIPHLGDDPSLCPDYAEFDGTHCVPKYAEQLGRKMRQNNMDNGDNNMDTNTELGMKSPGAASSKERFSDDGIFSFPPKLSYEIILLLVVVGFFLVRFRSRIIEYINGCFNTKKRFERYRRRTSVP